MIRQAQVRYTTPMRTRFRRAARRWHDAWLTPSGLLACTLGCASTAGTPRSVTLPWDTVIIPGCPTRDDGTLSDCLKERIVWGAHLWESGQTRSFIVSGAPTINRYGEALALAAGLAALSVPAEHIWLEPHARHTDENVYNAMRIIEQHSWRHIAVGTHAGQASGACYFLRSWQQPCELAALDLERAREMLLQTYTIPLHAVRIAPTQDPNWLHVRDLERPRANKGGPTRPPSTWLYWFWAPLTRLVGKPWRPIEPPAAPPQTYADWLAASTR